LRIRMRPTPRLPADNSAWTITALPSKRTKNP
jgi:hypothetical protein